MTMKGVGGPLLCIGDLLSDVADADDTTPPISPSSSGHAFPAPLHPLDLPHLFEETYSQLTDALSSTDHSWTVLTLKLCSALETANRLVQSANSNAGLLSEKLQALESIIRRGNSAMAKAKDVYGIQKEKEQTSSES